MTMWRGRPDGIDELVRVHQNVRLPDASRARSAWRIRNAELAADGACCPKRDLAVTWDGDWPLGCGTAPDVVTRAASDPLAAVGDQVPLELAECRHQASMVGGTGKTTTW